jgi:hypothetical protein
MQDRTHPISTAHKAEHFDTTTLTEIDKLNADIQAHREALRKLPEAAEKLLASALDGTPAKPENALQERDKLAGRKVALMVEEIRLMKRKDALGPLVEASNHAEADRLKTLQEKHIAKLTKAVQPLAVHDRQKAAMVNTDKEVVRLKRESTRLRQPVEILTASDKERLAELRQGIEAALTI